MAELSDAEVFGTQPAPPGAAGQMSDAEVFGTGKSATASAPIQNRWQQKKSAEVQPKDTWAETTRQFAAGENTGLVLSGLFAAQRAMGGNPGIATSGPKTPVQGIARTAGTGVGIAYDIIGALAAETGLPEIAAGIKAYTAAKPVMGSAALGAAYAGQQSGQSQYAETGKVDPSRQAMDALSGAVLGGAPSAIAKTGKAAMGAYDGLKDAVKERLGSVKDQYSALAEMMDKDAVKNFSASTQAVRDQKSALDQELTKAGLNAAPSSKVEGRGIQEGIVSKVRDLNDIRVARTQPLLDAAKAEAAAKEKRGEFVDASNVRAILGSEPGGAKLPIKEGEQTARNLGEWLFGPNKKIVSGGSVDAAGKTIPASQSSSQTTFGKMFAARKEVDKRLSTAADGSSEKKYYSGLKDAINDSLEKYSDNMRQYRAAYATYSEPINDLLQGGNYARKASELQDYNRREMPVSELKFEQNPQEVGRSFVNQGESGAAKIKAALGPGDDDFARGYFAREIHGADAKGIINAVDKNKDFLRAFPKLEQSLRKVAEQKAFLEGVQQHAMSIIDTNFSAGRVATPAQLQAGMRGALDSIDKASSEKKATETLSNAMDMIRRSGGNSETGRNLVSGYFSDKLTPIFESAAKDDLTAQQTATAVAQVAKDWNTKKQLLIDSGVMTKSHADDMQSVMNGLDSFSASLGKKKTVGQELKEERGRQLQIRLMDIAAYEAAEKVGLRGYQGVLIERAGSAVANLVKAYRNSTQKIVQDSIKDPVMAHHLAQAFKKRGNSPALLRHLMMYDLVPEQEQPQQDQQGEQ